MVPSHLEVHTVIAGLAELHYQYKALAEKIVVEKLSFLNTCRTTLPPLPFAYAVPNRSYLLICGLLNLASS